MMKIPVTGTPLVAAVVDDERDGRRTRRAERALHDAPRGRVEGREGLVEEEHGGTPLSRGAGHRRGQEDLARELELDRLAAGELGAEVRRRRRRRRGLLGSSSSSVVVGARGRRLRLGEPGVEARVAVGAVEEVEVGEDRLGGARRVGGRLRVRRDHQREEPRGRRVRGDGAVRPLRDVRDAVGIVRRRRSREASRGEANRAPRVSEAARRRAAGGTEREEREERRLARAVGPEDGDDVAGPRRRVPDVGARRAALVREPHDAERQRVVVVLEHARDVARAKRHRRGRLAVGAAHEAREPLDVRC
mmetsp:Transcript_14280/g.56896  ORF Transcript_14280/g.56896 Transcript_14280/m.56896 type:complete len:305 (+) Transcript_14280:296-1210(+)